jgi:hypothetical protein
VRILLYDKFGHYPPQVQVRKIEARGGDLFTAWPTSGDAVAGPYH